MKVLLFWAVTALCCCGQGHGRLCDPDQGSSCQANSFDQSGRCLYIGVCECEDMAVPDIDYNCHHSDVPSLTVVKPMLWSGEAVVGGILTLQCHDFHEKNQDVDYQWYKNGSRIVDATYYQLNFQNLKESDSGLYECSTISFDKQSKKSNEVILERVFPSTSYLKTKPTIVGMPSNAAPNSTIHLKCLPLAAISSHKFNWLVDGHKLRPSFTTKNDLSIEMGDDSWLGKMVQCEIELFENTLTRQILSDSAWTPNNFTEIFDHVNVTGSLIYKEKEPLSLSCSAPINFAPSKDTRYVWMYKGTEVIPNSNYQHLKIQGSNLTGEYHCIAIYGDVQITSQPVFVFQGMYPPSIKMISPSEWNGEALKYGYMTFKCIIPYHLYVEEYYWMKNGKVVHVSQSDTDWWVAYVEDSDYYQCRVKNQTSQAIYVPMTATLKRTPIVIGMPSTVSENSHAVLTCGNVPIAPKAKYIWSLKGKVLSESYDVETLQLVFLNSTFNQPVRCSVQFDDNYVKKELTSSLVLTPAQVTNDYNLSPYVTGRSMYLEGEKIELLCKLNADIATPAGSKFVWTGPHSQVLIWPSSSVHESGPNLTIWNAYPHYSGEYGCKVNSENGIMYSSATKLVTIGLPSPLHIEPWQQYWSGEILPSTSMKLTCAADIGSYHKYRWYRDGYFIHNSTGQFYSANSSGEYQCSLDFYGLWTELSNPLTMNVAKDLSDLSQLPFVMGMKQDFTEGDNLGLVCVNLPHGEKTIKWFIDDKEISEFQDLIELHNNFKSEWAGKKIKCEVQIISGNNAVHFLVSTPVQFPKVKYDNNNAKYDESTTHNFLSRPRIHVYRYNDQPVYYYMGPYYSGDEVNLQCGTFDESRRTVWQRNGKNISTTYNNKLVITIWNNQHVNNSGFYSCGLFFANRIIESYNSINITARPTTFETTTQMNYAPRISLNGYQGPFYEGAGITLYCYTADNKSYVYTRWKRNGDYLTTTYEGKYTMYSLEYADSGSYSCSVELNEQWVESGNRVYIDVLMRNTDGNRYEETTPQMNYTPRITLDGYQGPFYEGAGITFYCYTAGKKNVYTRWYRNGNYLTSTHEGKHTIYSLDYEDRGSYLCSVEVYGRWVDSSNRVYIDVWRKATDGDDHASSAVPVVPCLSLLILLMTMVQTFK